MADINVDVNLPNPISVDITSPTQALATNISIPGPQGPAGIQGPSGAQGPIGPQGPSGVVNTGEFDLRYYSINNPSGFITGVNLSNYATLNNLVSTGNILDNKINIFSGTYQNFVDNLDLSYATDIQLQNTGSTLSKDINNLSGTLTSNYYLKSNPSGFITGVDLSSYLTSSNASTTYATITNLELTGNTLQNQIDNLDNTYATDTNLTSTGSTLNNKINLLSGTLTSDYLTINSASNTYATINNLTSTGNILQGNINTLSSNLNFTGSTLNSNINALSGTLTSTYATINNLVSTGNTLVNSINSLSGTLTSNYATITNLQTTGATLDTKINSLSGYVNSQDSSISNNLVSTGSTLISSINSLSNNLLSTGSSLESKINSLSGYSNNTFATILNVNSTGVTLDNKINTLSGSSVLLYGDQSIGGIKTFRDRVYINNLYVTGIETILSTTNNNISSPYLLLNLTGGLTDGGIFFVTGSGLTGINDTGVIFGFDNITKTWHFGQGTRLTDISTLDEVMGYHDLAGYSGYANQTFGTIINLANTGLTLQNNINTVSSNLTNTGTTLTNSINSLSGYSNSTFATITNLSNTGSTLQVNINTISSNLVTTGNTLNNSINALSGTLTSTYATINNLTSTGSTLNTNINSLSGVSVLTFGNQLINGTKTFNSGVVINVQPTGTSPALNITGTWNNASQVYTGINLNITDINSNTESLFFSLISNSDTKIKARKDGTFFVRGGNNRSQGISTDAQYMAISNSLGGLVIYGANLYGADAAGLLGTFNLGAFGSTVGTANFSSAGDINWNSDLYIRRDSANILAQRNGTNPQQFRIYNTTGTNSGEFGLVGWINSGLIIGPQRTSSGILRDLTLTGNNININASGILNIFNNTNIVGNLNVTGNILLSGNPVLTGVDLSAYATNINLALSGSTLDSKINSLSGYGNNTFSTITNLASTGSTLDIKINSLTGTLTNDYVTKTNGSFTNRPTVNGTGVLLSGEGGGSIVLPDTLIYTTGNQVISGVKTFTQTGEFQAIRLNKTRLLSYDYETGNFNFTDYITIVNCPLTGSGDFTTGILPIGNPQGNISGFNFFLKNINVCPVLITGSGNYSIDGTPNLYIYSGESVELIGVNAINLTGWFTLNTNLGAV